jgi:transcriptional regulator with GAF, ATPase, and Fis domain
MPASETLQVQTYLGVRAVVSSDTMRALMEQVRRVAQSDATVVITGESGTGKEIVARAIHHYSLRSTKAFVDVNCAALPDTLVESELFGHEKGAFSGADAPKQGLFELADGGTIYLDEIGEMDPRAQAKLLRVLDGIPYYRLGGVRRVSVNVRVITATNSSLEDAVQNGRFRSDLYHRIMQVRLAVPPLRERGDDILALAEFFLLQQNPELSFTAEASRALLAYSWPGNIRELRNLVTRAALFARGPAVDVDDLGLTLETPPTRELPAVPATVHLETLERQAILKALDETAGHQGRAADLLGISVRTLSRKLAQYGQGRVPAFAASGQGDELA